MGAIYLGVSLAGASDGLCQTSACDQTCASGLKARDLRSNDNWPSGKRSFKIAVTSEEPEGFGTVYEEHLAPAVHAYDGNYSIDVTLGGTDIRIHYVLQQLYWPGGYPIEAPAATTFTWQSESGQPVIKYADIWLNCFTYGTDRWNEEIRWYDGNKPDPRVNCPGPNQFDLTTVFVHEIGHALGLKHTNHLCSVMVEMSPEGVCRRTLAEVDRYALLCKYPLTTMVRMTWGGVKALFRALTDMNEPQVLALSGEANTVVWVPDDQNDFHVVFRWTANDDPDSAFVVGIVTGSDSMLVDADVEPGIVYHYRVASEDGETLVDLGTAEAGLKLISDTVIPDPANGVVNGLAVHGSYAYLAFSHRIQKYDISNPAAPVLVASRTDDAFDFAVKRIALSEDGSKLYVLTYTGLVILDTTSPSLALWGWRTGIVTGSWSALEATVDLAVDGGVVYASFAGKGLYAFDVSSPNAIGIAGIYEPGPETAIAGEVEKVGEFLYLSVPDANSSALGRSERLSVQKQYDVFGGWHVSFSVECSDVDPGCFGSTAHFPSYSSGTTKGLFGLGHNLGQYAIMALADESLVTPIKSIEPYTNAPGMIITDPFGIPTDTLSFWPLVDDYDFDSRFMYATTPVLNDPYGRSVVAFDVWSGDSGHLFAAGDTLGSQILPGKVRSQGRYLYVIEDFLPDGDTQHEPRFRIYEKATGCKPDPEAPVRLFPDQAAFRVGQEVTVSLAVGCPVGVTVELVEDGNTAGVVHSESYAFPDDVAYVTQWLVEGISSDLQNHSYEVRVTANYADGPSASFLSKPFRVETRNRLDVALSGQTYSSIQAAMNAAVSGDTVVVHEGVYGEHLALKSNVIVVAPQGASIAPTTPGSAIVASGLVHPPTVDGLFIQFAPGITEAGIRITDCGVQFRNCTLNSLTRAVDINNGYGQFDGCTFTNNYEPLGGGAAWISPAATGPATTFTDCTFSGNSAGTRGGAVYIGGATGYDPSAPQVSFERCTFSANSAPEAAAVRIGINRRPVFNRCLFVGNQASSPSAGSVVGGLSDAGGVFANCTIADNSGAAPFDIIQIEPMAITSPVTVDASIFVDNTAASAFPTAYGAEYGISRSDFFANGSGDATWAAQGVDCFSLDPAFCGPGEYTLYSHSPCAAGVETESLVGAMDVACSPPAIVELTNGLGGLAPDSLLFGCPGGDADSFVVRIDFDDNVLTREPAASELVLAPPYAPQGIWASSPLIAGGPAAAPGFVTTLRHRFVSGTGVDSLEILLNGYPLAEKPVLERRGPDLNNDGEVDVQDLAIFGIDYQSPPKVYNSRSDFNGDGTVSVNDYGAFGTHIYHKHPLETEPLAAAALQLSAASIGLRFEESDPLQGEHRLRAYVLVENAELFKALLIALESENPVFEFIAWHPNPGYPQVTMGTRTDWNGKSVVMIGALGNKNSVTSYHELGYFDVAVHSESAVEPSTGDFELLVADVLDVGGSVLSVPASSTRRTYSAPVYRNALGQNYPNPFNPATTIAFSLESRAHTTLLVYDVRGARVRTLVDKEYERGNHRVSWNGDNDGGRRVASGVYFYRLTAGSFQSARKMVLLR